ncbi:hypothetical protein FDG2_1619 [Candidatus Protofrankia californiensis]|uniref:Uncharacterized protein n=1 Tax=Candidatus Protofrankia californiensis TaxID=1839754 RepID=A0A1C3NW28_9ACTN|nr:hypothetical protein FDG2_1619 [Candidatus Protofrankia californiensis]
MVMPIAEESRGWLDFADLVGFCLDRRVPTKLIDGLRYHRRAGALLAGLPGQ